MSHCCSITKPTNTEHRVMVEESLPLFAPCCWGDFVPTFRKKVPHYSSMLWATLPTSYPEGEVGTFHRSVENKVPNHIQLQPQGLGLRYENKLQHLAALCYFQWIMRQASRITAAVSFSFGLFLSLCYRNDQMSGCAMGSCLREVGGARGGV